MAAAALKLPVIIINKYDDVILPHTHSERERKEKMLEHPVSPLLCVCVCVCVCVRVCVCVFSSCLGNILQIHTLKHSLAAVKK